MRVCLRVALNTAVKPNVFIRIAMEANVTPLFVLRIALEATVRHMCFYVLLWKPLQNHCFFLRVPMANA